MKISSIRSQLNSEVLCVMLSGGFPEVWYPVNLNAETRCNPAIFFGELLVSVAPNASGLATITVTVDDGQTENHEFSRSLDVIVTAENDPPELIGLSDRQISENSLLQIALEAVDVDRPTNVLTFSLEGEVPLGAVIDGVTGELTWTPSEVQGPSTNLLTVRVADDIDLLRPGDGQNLQNLRFPLRRFVGSRVHGIDTGDKNFRAFIGQIIIDAPPIVDQIHDLCLCSHAM